MEGDSGSGVGRSCAGGIFTTLSADMTVGREGIESRGEGKDGRWFYVRTTGGFGMAESHHSAEGALRGETNHVRLSWNIAPSLLLDSIVDRLLLAPINYPIITYPVNVHPCPADSVRTSSCSSPRHALLTTPPAARKAHAASHQLDLEVIAKRTKRHLDELEVRSHTHLHA